jgi:hypothetical protein
MENGPSICISLEHAFFSATLCKICRKFNRRSCRKPALGTWLPSPVVNFAVALFSTLDRFSRGCGGTRKNFTLQHTTIVSDSQTFNSLPLVPLAEKFALPNDLSSEMLFIHNLHTDSNPNKPLAYNSNARFEVTQNANQNKITYLHIRPISSPLPSSFTPFRPSSPSPFSSSRPLFPLLYLLRLLHPTDILITINCTNNNNNNNNNR